jgi:hypothetical protein
MSTRRFAIRSLRANCGFSGPFVKSFSLGAGADSVHDFFKTPKGPIKAFYSAPTEVNVIISQSRVDPGPLPAQAATSRWGRFWSVLSQLRARH